MLIAILATIAMSQPYRIDIMEETLGMLKAN
jgi:hypothetical protein